MTPPFAWGRSWPRRRSRSSLADGALAAGGRVVGVIPNFMAEIEWGHTGVNELLVVDDMHGRKRIMLEQSDAVIALPGGCGTFEELLEAITLKRLGIYHKPIVLVNTRNYFDKLQELMQQCVAERFMSEKHLAMWQLVERPEDVLGAIAGAKNWGGDAREFAVMK
ncbi:MAG: TIGR00730 family Rossman fold protein [Planctomycetota bacterium]|nr:TIGR00730 family Rossman fold protein [Planctomycetota bacterium]